MSDGAHQGIMPERALDTILGGKEPPEKDEGMSRQQMRDAIAAVDIGATPESYDEACMLTARLIFDFVVTDPATRRLIPGDGEYEWPLKPDGSKDYNQPSIQTVKGLYDVMKEAGPPYDGVGELGLTGFMWGWAVNAARYALSELPVANPAIL